MTSEQAWRSPARPWHGMASWAVAVVLVIMVAGFAWHPWQARQASARGQALFEGVSLVARQYGDDAVLPAAATRCANCHGAASGNDAAARVAANTGLARPASTFAPLLGRALLTQQRARRGGPPSAYDARALCTLLRTGVDPAYVMVPSVMPRYDLGDAQCQDLWAYLESQP